MKRGRWLTARAGDSITCTYFRRGDVLRVSGNPREPDMYVWSNDGCTLTIAVGWRRWYLRLVYNPFNRALEWARGLLPWHW